MDLVERKQQPNPKLVKEVFPLEIWSEIFKYLHSAQDLLSIFDTSQVLRELLNPNKVFPLIFPLLSSVRVLNCRSINYQWSEMVDDFFKFHPPHNDIGTFSSTIDFPFHPIFKPLTDRKIEELLDSPTNPFAITRYLSYHDEWFFGQVKHEILLSVVQKFGSEILHFDLAVKNFESGQNILINSCLRSMPNLKTVSIFVEKSTKFVAETAPDAPQLDEVVKLSTNIKGMLDIGGLGVSLKQLCTKELLPNMEMSVLEHLHTNVISQDDLRKLGALKSPLKVLKLTAVRCSATVDLSTIFDAMAHFDYTLRELYFEYYVRDGEETDGDLELVLPSLEKLQINVGNHRLESVDFLLPCMALEQLCLVSCGSFNDKYRYGRARGELPVIQFLGFESSMYDSNIWEHLPNLQILEVKDRSEIFEYCRSNL